MWNCGLMTCRDGQPSLQHNSDHAHCVQSSNIIRDGIWRLPIYNNASCCECLEGGPGETSVLNCLPGWLGVTNSTLKRSQRCGIGEKYSKDAVPTPDTLGHFIIRPSNSSLQCRGHPLTCPALQMLATHILMRPYTETHLLLSTCNVGKDDHRPRQACDEPQMRGQCATLAH